MPGLFLSLPTRPPGASPFFPKCNKVCGGRVSPKHSTYSVLFFPCHRACLVPPRGGMFRKFVCCLWDCDSGSLNNSFSNVYCSCLQVQVSKIMVINISFLTKESPIGFSKFPPRGTSTKGWHYRCTSYENRKMIAPQGII